jgi:hypothetical protein
MSRYDDLIEMIAVQTDDCIVWPYSKSKGYGKVWHERRMQRCHRLALATVSPPPTASHQAAHGPCHNPACVNPFHLSWKTQVENHADKYRDGTDHNGESNGRCKLTTAQVAEIRARYRETHQTQQSLADEYGVSQPQISFIVNFRQREIS